jgi:hypothetical protein
MSMKDDLSLLEGYVYRAPLTVKYNGKRWKYCVSKGGEEKLQQIIMRGTSFEVCKVLESDVWLLR